MLTKGAIGNLVNRYRAVLKKCNLMNTFGSLAVASMLVLGGAGVAAAAAEKFDSNTNPTHPEYDNGGRVTMTALQSGNLVYDKDTATVTVTAENNLISGTNASTYNVYASLQSDANPKHIGPTVQFVGDSNTVVHLSTNGGYNVVSRHGAVLFGSEDSHLKSITMESIGGHMAYVTAYNYNNYNHDLKQKLEFYADTVTITAGDGKYAFTGNGGSAKIVADSVMNITGHISGYNSVYGGVDDMDYDLNFSSGSKAVATIKGDVISSGTSVVKIGMRGEGSSLTGNVTSKGFEDNIKDGGVIELAFGDNGTLTGDVLSKSKGEVNITYGKNGVLAGNVKAEQAQLNIEATDITINGNVESRSGEGAGHLPYVGIKASGDAVINGSMVAHWAEGNSEHAYGLEIEGKNVAVNAGENNVLYNGAGKANIAADEKLTLNGKNGLINEGGDINVSAKNVNITAEKYAVLSYVGNTNITGSGSSNITGDILLSGLYTNAAPVVNIELGNGSSITGAIVNEREQAAYALARTASGIYINLGDGSTWNATGDSNVTSLSGNDITVNIGADTQIEASNISGNGGNINMMDTNSSFTAANADADASFQVQAIDADGNVQNADQVTKDTLMAMQKKVNVTDADGNQLTTTASATEGIVNAGFTMDGEGNIVAGGGASLVTKAVLEAASVNTVSLDRILTNDVRKRMGDLRADKNESGVWMRWDGGKLKGNSGLTNNFNTIQIGGDTKVAKNCRLGVAGSFTHGDSEFARGNGQLEGFSLAAYSTWMGENGMFADVVARLGNFSTEMNVEGLKGDMDNRVFSLSGEYGWRFNVCEQFFIEPQVELAYTYVSSDNLELGNASFDFDNVNSLTGRAGLVAGWNLPDDMGNVYARASVLQQFLGDAKVTGYATSGATIHETDGNDTWLEYGIGANVKLTDKASIWADVERTEGAEIEEEWRGTVGIRYSF